MLRLLLFGCVLAVAVFSLYSYTPFLGNAQQEYIRGNAYYFGLGGFRKDPVEARRWLAKAAAKGHPKAQNNLGLIYSGGEGVAKNEPEAAKWLEKASAQGYLPATHNLGLLYCQDKKSPLYNEKKALEIFEKAGKVGYDKSMYWLWVFYIRGMAVAKNEKAALAWLKKSAEKGNAAACSDLGEIYMHGHYHETRDPVLAMAWVLISGNTELLKSYRSRLPKDAQRRAVQEAKKLREKFRIGEPEPGS